jgi:hypothetical protein
MVIMSIYGEIDNTCPITKHTLYSINIFFDKLKKYY